MPFVFIVILAVVAAGATISTVHVPWVLLVLLAVFFWYRGGWHGHHLTSTTMPTGSIDGAAPVRRHLEVQPPINLAESDGTP